MDPISFEEQVAAVVAELIAENPRASVPVAWRPDRSAYPAGQLGIYLDLYPAREHVALTTYMVDDDPTLSDSTIGLQVRVQHPSPSVVKAVLGDVFDLLHGRPRSMLGPVTLVTAGRVSGTNVGQNAGGAFGRLENYHLGVHRPSTHRT